MAFGIFWKIAGAILIPLLVICIIGWCLGCIGCIYTAKFVIRSELKRERPNVIEGVVDEFGELL